MQMRYICILLACFAMPVFGQQDGPRVEVFGGYSYLHIDTQGVTGGSLDTLCNDLAGAGTCPPGTFHVHQSFNGWTAAAQFDATRLLGIKADFSGNYGTPIALSSQAQSFLSQHGVTGLPPKTTSYNYLFGPVAYHRAGRYKPFAHALFGANRVSTNLSTASGLGIPGLTLSDTAFAMAFGGGLDVKLSDDISLRVGQADYLFTKHDLSGGVKGIASHQNNFRASVGMVFQFGGHVTQSRQPTPQTSPGMIAIPALGVYVTSDNAGAQITEVVPNGVAARAGLRPSDIINTVNGAQIKTPLEVAAAVSGVPPGSTVRLGVIIRGLWQTETSVTLANH
jgi:opacity protein-like surface antigen